MPLQTQVTTSGITSSLSTKHKAGAEARAHHVPSRLGERANSRRPVTSARGATVQTLHYARGERGRAKSLRATASRGRASKVRPGTTPTSSPATFNRLERRRFPFPPSLNRDRLLAASCRRASTPRRPESLQSAAPSQLTLSLSPLRGRRPRPRAGAGTSRQRRQRVAAWEWEETVG